MSLLERAREHGASSTGGVRTGRDRRTSRRDEEAGFAHHVYGRYYGPRGAGADPSSARRDRVAGSSSSRPSSARKARRPRGEATADYRLEDGSGSDDDDGIDSREGWSDEAHFKQTAAPFSTAFCLVQCAVLPLMMWQCGVAPLNINPMIGPYPDALNYWGAKNAVLIIDDGEFWRLFTPIFLHAGLIHLAGNVMVQIDAGNQWEKEWGCE